MKLSGIYTLQQVKWGFKEVVFVLQNKKNSISSMKYKKVNQISLNYIGGKIFL
jgi:hypothetical protein